MRDPAQRHLLLLVLLLGVFLLTQQQDQLPHGLAYCLMLIVLGGTRQLAGEWFAQPWLDTFWRVCVGVAAAGLLVETATRLIG